MKRHYHVIENTPGYLPDSDPYITTRRADAERVASSLARELREDGYKTWGSARSWSIHAERDSSDLGRVIEIVECTDDLCAEYIEEEE